MAGANGVSIAARNANSGGAWSNISYSGSTTTPLLTNGAGACSEPGNNFSNLMVNSDVGASGDGTFYSTFSDTDTNIINIIYLLRVQVDDTAIYFNVRYNSGSGNVEAAIGEVTSGGTFNQIGATENVSSTWGTFPSGSLDVECSGTTITAKLNGTTLVSRTATITGAGRNAIFTRAGLFDEVEWISSGGASAFIPIIGRGPGLALAGKSGLVG
jgi:hypothetical protein